MDIVLGRRVAIEAIADELVEKRVVQVGGVGRVLAAVPESLPCK